MHLYNAWLPPPVAERAAAEEPVVFRRVVTILQQTWNLDHPSSAYATLKWVSLVNNLIKAKSELLREDLQTMARIALEVILHAPAHNLFLQARWGNCLSSLLRKHHKKLDLIIEWRPLYELLLRVHFKRQETYDGWALKHVHLETITSLVCHCREFFPSVAAKEVWCEFRPAIQDLSHNSSLEAVGFISLFLPTKMSKQRDDTLFFTSDWFSECLTLWGGIQNCHYWDLQWSSLLGRFIKHQTLTCEFEMEPFLPTLFMRFLNLVEVPIGKSTSINPIQREVPHHFKLAFNATSLPKVVAKSIVFLLRPNGSAQARLEVLIDLLEQYYHPSNGGSWTPVLEKFLRYVVDIFLKRLAYEQKTGEKLSECPGKDYFLGISERILFIKAVLRLIERGQYSKSGRLAGTAAKAASSLAFVAPSLVLPVVASRFQAALDTVTATHQLESAVNTLALTSRAMLLASVKEQSGNSESDVESSNLDTSHRVVSYFGDSSIDYRNLVVDAMFQTLLGLDANDPPKTLATIQFYCSVLSSVEPLDDEKAFFAIDWSLWLDEFLDRVFVLLVHLESNVELGDVSTSDGIYLSSQTFLMQDQSLWTSLLELLFSRLSPPLFKQALKKISKFVLGNILPGAAAEVGFLCAVIVYAHPMEGVLNLLEPILVSVISLLTDSHSPAFHKTSCSKNMAALRATLSPGLETSVLYHLNVLSVAVMYGGAAVLHCKELLKTAIASAFDAPSLKVNEAGNRVLSSLLGTLVLYFPLDQYKSSLSYPGIDGLELWISASAENHITSLPSCPRWHIANNSEIEYAKELVDLHFKDALLDLRGICQGHLHANDAGKAKERLRVLLLRLDACLRGLHTCLPDFKSFPEVSSPENNESVLPLSIVGQAGVAIGDSNLREEAAETLHEACKFLLKERADDTTLLMLLIHVLDLTGNYGSLEYSEWSTGKQSWKIVSKTLSEPRVNFITDHHASGKRRPQWLVVEMASLHNTWRASQSKYRPFYGDTNNHIPNHVTHLSMDLLSLCLHTYDAVRVSAGNSLKKILKRYPPLIKDCMPLLTSSLKDPQAGEHSALGACMVLTSRPVLRHLTQDRSSLTSFVLAVLGSSHHESLKAQKAINEVFIAFQIRFEGARREALELPLESRKENQLLTYGGLTSFVKDILDIATSSVHWRYNLMGNGMLLCLASLLPSPKDVSQVDTSLALRYEITGHFLRNLKSELPPLRPLSAIALLLLLGTSRLMEREKELSSESQLAFRSINTSLAGILKDRDFCECMVHSLALDRHYSEGQGGGGRGAGRFQLASDLGITAMMPSVSRGWPRTWSWESTIKGESFSARTATLFKRLLQECGSSFLEALHSPLEHAINEVNERSKQCIASELVAGILHSDVPYVSEAWDSWLEKLFYKALMQANVESVPEWAACIRYAVTGKGKTGQRAPILRHKVLVTLARPLPSSSSTSLIVKRLDFLLAASVELSPTSLEKEYLFQQAFLEEAVNYMSHSAPQVRESVGRLICILYSNLLQISKTHPETLTQVDHQVEDNKISNWAKILVDGTLTAAAKIERHGRVSTIESSPNPAVSNNDDEDEVLNDSVKWMETIFHFTISGIKSGRTTHLMPIFIGILYPLLSSQDSSHKDMSTLAKSTVHLLKWQTVDGTYGSQALTAILTVAADSNWRTRIASLTFLQIFIYRHNNILERSDIALVWEHVHTLLSDPQLEVREMATATLSGLMKGADSQLASSFRDKAFQAASSLINSKPQSREMTSRLKTNSSIACVHGMVLGLVACILSAPYDIPRWLPGMIVMLSKFSHQPAPIRSTVTKTISEFRRTHADTWAFDKNHFSESQLEPMHFFVQIMDFEHKTNSVTVYRYNTNGQRKADKSE